MSSTKKQKTEPVTQSANEATSTKVVCVTGASGFIASHIVAQLLLKGYTVRGTVRNAQDESKTKHLMALPGAKERLHLFSADLMTTGAFDDIFTGCEGVFHTATPVIFGDPDPKKSIYEPGMKGLQIALDAVKKNKSTIKTFVLTSSMAAMAPKPEPTIKTECHWSDAEEQKERKNWYGATKTLQEKMAEKFFSEEPYKTIRYCAICPTMVVGPMLQPAPNATMKYILGIVKTGNHGKPASNDSMSFIDVRDCAALHVAAYETPAASGRYMALVESLHWNDILKLLKDICPNMPDVTFFEATADAPLAVVTKFDRSRMDSLGVKVRDIKTLLKEAIEAGGIELK